MARVANFVCHRCMLMVCTNCLFKLHRDEGPGGPATGEMHEYEQIDDFMVSVKQIVWLINSKLQRSITKLAFLQSKLRITLQRDPDDLPENTQDTTESNVKQNASKPSIVTSSITLDYVL